LKNRPAALGASPQPLASGGWGLCPQNPASGGWGLRNRVLIRDGRSLLFLTPTLLLLQQIQLRLQSYFEKFSNIILRLHSDSEIFKVWETNSDVKIDSNSNKLTKNALRLHSESDKKRHTPTPIRLRSLPISGAHRAAGCCSWSLFQTAVSQQRSDWKWTNDQHSYIKLTTKLTWHSKTMTCKYEYEHYEISEPSLSAESLLWFLLIKDKLPFEKKGTNNCSSKS